MKMDGVTAVMIASTEMNEVMQDSQKNDSKVIIMLTDMLQELNSQQKTAISAYQSAIQNISYNDDDKYNNKQQLRLTQLQSAEKETENDYSVATKSLTNEVDTVKSGLDANNTSASQVMGFMKDMQQQLTTISTLLSGWS